MGKNIFIICFVLFCSCGTGPWTTKKKLFEAYKYPVYENKTFDLRIDGVYVEEPDLLKRVRYRIYFVFYRNGYCLKGFVSEEKWNKSFLSSFKSIKTHPKTGFGVYKIKNDSIWVNDFDYNPNLYYRWAINYNGKILNNSTFYFYENRTDLEGYLPEKRIVNFKFYQTNELPEYVNTSWYLKKKWYQKNVHESRKK